MIDPAALRIANRLLWDAHPELHGRPLTGAPKDAQYRREWIRFYQRACQGPAKPPAPRHTPRPVPPLPPRKPTPVLACSLVGNMGHFQKMEQALLLAHLQPAVLKELGGLDNFLHGLLIGGAVALTTVAVESVLATTGVGAGVDALADATAVIVVAARLGNVYGIIQNSQQIGKGLAYLLQFYQETQCNRAQTEADLERSGRHLAHGIAAVGVGGFQMAMALLGSKESEEAESEHPHAGSHETEPHEGGTHLGTTRPVRPPEEAAVHPDSVPTEPRTGPEVMSDAASGPMGTEADGTPNLDAAPAAPVKRPRRLDEGVRKKWSNLKTTLRDGKESDESVGEREIEKLRDLGRQTRDEMQKPGVPGRKARWDFGQDVKQVVSTVQSGPPSTDDKNQK